MHPWDELSEDNWPEIENALSSIPIEPPPADLYSTIMHQIEKPGTANKPPVLCSWLDAAFSLFAAAMVCLVFLFIKLSALYPEAGLTLNWLYQWMTVPTIFFSLLGAFLVTIASLLFFMFMLLVLRN